MDNNLGFLMTREGIGPTELSKRINVSRNTIQRVLRKEKPSFETMYKIAKYFKKDVDQIFFVSNVLHVERNKKTA